MATVYLAQDVKHDRKVALKVLHPELAATLGPERFQREIRTTARLQHPHILTVLDSGEAAGQLWYTMPFVDGESLRGRLQRERQLSVDEALQITPRSSGRSRLCPQPKCGASGHQAGKHPPQPGARAGGRLRDRASPPSGRQRPADPNRHVGGHTGVYESRAEPRRPNLDAVPTCIASVACCTRCSWAKRLTPASLPKRL